MQEYYDLGITDIYLLVKGYGGKLAWQSKVSGTTMSYTSRDILEEKNMTEFDDQLDIRP